MKLIRRGRTYWLDIRVGAKRHRVSLHTDEYGLALERARDKAIELKAGDGKPGAGLRFKDFSPKYLAWARDTKPRNVRTETCHLNAMIGYFESQGLSRLDEVTPYHVEQFRMWIRTQDRRTHPKEGSPPVLPSKATTNRYCALLRKFYNLALDWEIYKGTNPVSKVKFYKEDGTVRPISPEDFEKVIAAAREIAAKPQSPIQRVITDLIMLSINTGLRKSEALNLRWRGIRDDEIEVRGKGDKIRRVPLNDTAREIIERQPRLGPFVFDVPNRAQNDLLRRTVRQIRKKSGVLHFRYHLTRHFFTSSLLAAGVDIQTISELLGHSKILTSLIYSHSTPQRRRDAVAALDTKRGHRPSDGKSVNYG